MRCFHFPDVELPQTSSPLSDLASKPGVAIVPVPDEDDDVDDTDTSQGNIEMCFEWLQF